MNRRDFLCASVGAACATAALPAMAGGLASRLRVALVGCAPRGLALADAASHSGECRITAAWDADPALARAAASHGAVAYTDLRDLLNAEQPDLAIVAGRASAALIRELLQAGAHLFLDSAPRASIAESRMLLKAAGEAGKVVQVHSGMIGLRHCPEASALLQSGRVGRFTAVRAHTHYHQPSAPCVEPGPMLEWAGEILTMSGQESLRRVTATGNEQNEVITWEFDRLTAIWERRIFPGAAEERVATGGTWYGSAGVLCVNGDAWRFLPHGQAREECGTISGRDRDAACWSDFIRAIREQRQPRHSLDVALNAAEMVRVAECSLKLERPLEWDERRRLVVRDEEANRLLRSAPEWLA